MNKKLIKLDEFTWEGYVYSHPKKFIGEELTKFSKQRSSKSGRSDLIFKDKKKNILIVELQCHALDKDHMRRAMDYKDDLIEEGMSPEKIRVMLLCNDITEKKRYYLERHKLELKIVSEIKVRKIIKDIDSRIEFTDMKEEVDHAHDQEELDLWKLKEKIKREGNLKKAIEEYPDEKEFISEVRLNFIKKKGIITPALTKHFYDLNSKFEHLPNRDGSFAQDNILGSENNDTVRIYKLQNELKKELYYLSKGNRYYTVTDQDAKSRAEDAEIFTKDLDGARWKKCLFNLKNINIEKISKENRKPKIDLCFWPGTHHTHYDSLWLYWRPSNWTLSEDNSTESDFNFSYQDMQYIFGHGSSYQERWDFSILCLPRKDLFYDGTDNNNVSGRAALILNHIIHNLIKELSYSFDVQLLNEISYKTKKLDTQDELFFKKIEKEKNKNKRGWQAYWDHGSGMQTLEEDDLKVIDMNLYTNAKGERFDNWYLGPHFKPR